MRGQTCIMEGSADLVCLWVGSENPLWGCNINFWRWKTSNKYSWMMVHQLPPIAVDQIISRVCNQTERFIRHGTRVGGGGLGFATAIIRSCHVPMWTRDDKMMWYNCTISMPMMRCTEYTSGVTPEKNPSTKKEVANDYLMLVGGTIDRIDICISAQGFVCHRMHISSHVAQ